MSGGDGEGGVEDEIELKSGGRVPVRAALECFKFLEISQEHRPREFETILVVAGKKQGRFDGAEYQGLREAGIIAEDGRLATLYQAVVDSSVAEVAPGEYALLAPCRADREADRERWHREELRFEQNLLGSFRTAQHTKGDSLPPRR